MTLPNLSRFPPTMYRPSTGGLRDKPGKRHDFYHTCYCLSGLSSAQHFGGAGVLGARDCTPLPFNYIYFLPLRFSVSRGTICLSGRRAAAGDPRNEVERTHPLLNVSEKSLERWSALVDWEVPCATSRS